MSVSLRLSEQQAGDIGSQGLSEGPDEDDEEYDPQDLGTGEQDPDIDEHTHTNQEIGDEQSVADKLDAVHQGRHVGDIPVEYQTGEERSEDALDADGRRQGCTEEHDAQHEDILHDGITVSTQE